MAWQFGADLMYYEKSVPSNSTRLWLCKACHLQNRNKGSLLNARGSNAIGGHLLREDRIGKDGKEVPSKPGPLDKHLTFNPRSSSMQDFDPEKQRLVVLAFPDWVDLQNLSFGQATSPTTIAVFQLLRDGTHNFFYGSRCALSKLINESYTRRQDEILHLFNGAMSSIHLSNDLWSTTNNLSLLGIVAHFLDALYKHRTILLDLPHLWGSHDGPNQAEAILKVTSRYGISDQTGTFTMVNASNNDTMVDAIGLQLPHIKSSTDSAVPAISLT